MRRNHIKKRELEQSETNAKSCRSTYLLSSSFYSLPLLLLSLLFFVSFFLIRLIEESLCHLNAARSRYTPSTIRYSRSDVLSIATSYPLVRSLINSHHI